MIYYLKGSTHDGIEQNLTPKWIYPLTNIFIIRLLTLIYIPCAYSFGSNVFSFVTARMF